MPRRNLHISALSELTLDAMNAKIGEINAALEQLEQVEIQIRGEEGNEAMLGSNLEMQGNRICGVGRTQKGTDVPNRDEVQQIVKRAGEEQVPTVLQAVNLTDSTTGAADDTVQNVGAAFSQTTLNNNFADVAAKINVILRFLRRQSR